MKKTIWINIAGDSFPVVFNGEMVAMPQFPDIPVEYTAPCGTKITQDMLVLICRNKLGIEPCIHATAC
jgi:hypothetical protein